MAGGSFQARNWACATMTTRAFAVTMQDPYPLCHKGTPGLFVFSCQLLLFVLTCIQHSMYWIFHYVIFWKRQSYRKENISVLTRGWACCDCNTESQGVLGVIEYSTPLLLWWFQEYVLQFPELDAERDEFYWSVFAKWKSLKKCSDF